MITLEVPTTAGVVTEKVYNINDFPYATFEKLPLVKKKDVEYYNISCSFDIETTTIPRKIETDRDIGFMYQWQACIKDTVIFGRTWEEFIKFLDDVRLHFELSENRILVIYITIKQTDMSTFKTHSKHSQKAQH